MIRRMRISVGEHVSIGATTEMITLADLRWLIDQADSGKFADDTPVKFLPHGTRDNPLWGLALEQDSP